MGWSRSVVLGVVVLASTSCGGSTKPAQDPYTEGAAQARAMSLRDAQKVVDDAAAQVPSAGPTPPAPTSVAEAIDLIVRDRADAFDEVVHYLEGQPGPEPRALRAFTLVSRGELEKLVSRLVGDQTRRAAADLRRLRAREESGGELDETSKKRLDSLRADLERGVRLEVALDLLAAPHLREGEELAMEVARDTPKGTLAPVAIAMAAAAKRTWPEFDTAMRSVERHAALPAASDYLRAVEQQDRYTRNDRARDLLANALAQAPGYVRAQARLVVAQDDVAGTYREMEKLCAQAAYHPLCRLGRGLVERAQAAEQSAKPAK